MGGDPRADIDPGFLGIGEFNPFARSSPLTSAVTGTQAAVGGIIAPEPEAPSLRPVTPEFRRRRRREEEAFDLFGTLFAGQPGALESVPQIQTKKLLGG